MITFYSQIFGAWGLYPNMSVAVCTSMSTVKIMVPVVETKEKTSTKLVNHELKPVMTIRPCVPLLLALLWKQVWPMTPTRWHPPDPPPLLRWGAARLQLPAERFFFIYYYLFSVQETLFPSYSFFPRIMCRQWRFAPRICRFFHDRVRRLKPGGLRT